MSAIFVKMPPATRNAAAPRLSPIAKPMKHGPARVPGMNSRIASMITSSTEISIMPMLMPDCSGIDEHGNALPVSAANDVRELANVFTRMPNAATKKLPLIPTTLNNTMIATL